MGPDRQVCSHLLERSDLTRFSKSLVWVPPSSTTTFLSKHYVHESFGTMIAIDAFGTDNNKQSVVKKGGWSLVLAALVLMAIFHQQSYHNHSSTTTTTTNHVRQASMEATTIELSYNPIPQQFTPQQLTQQDLQETENYSSNNKRRNLGMYKKSHGKKKKKKHYPYKSYSHSSKGKGKGKGQKHPYAVDCTPIPKWKKGHHRVLKSKMSKNKKKWGYSSKGKMMGKKSKHYKGHSQVSTVNVTGNEDLVGE